MMGRSAGCTSTRLRRPKIRRAIWGRTAVFGAALVGCAVQRGNLPAIAKASPEDGFKLLKPHARVRRCAGSLAAGLGRSNDALLATAVGELLARDEEANALRNVAVEWTWRSIGLYGWHCIELQGDLVRSTSSVLLPMSHGHGTHEPQ